MLLSLAMTQCGQYSKTTFIPIDGSSVDSIIMTVREKESDRYKKLTEEQVDELITNINSAKSFGLTKGVTKYRFHIYQKDPHTKDTSTRLVSAFESLFKFKHETGDETFIVSDTTLFARLATDNSVSTHRLGPSDLFIAMTNYIDSLGYLFDTTRLKKVRYFSEKNYFAFADKFFYRIKLPNHEIFHLIGFTNNYDGVDTSKIKKHLFYAAENIFGYFYCEKVRTDGTLVDGVIEEWQFKNDIQADSAGQELNRIRNLAFFYTASFVTRTKNKVYVFHNRGSFDHIHKKTIKRFKDHFDVQYPLTIPNSDQIKSDK